MAATRDLQPELIGHDLGEHDRRAGTDDLGAALERIEDQEVGDQRRQSQAAAPHRR